MPSSKFKGGSKYELKRVSAGVRRWVERDPASPVTQDDVARPLVLLKNMKALEALSSVRGTKGVSVDSARIVEVGGQRYYVKSSEQAPPGAPFREVAIAALAAELEVPTAENGFAFPSGKDDLFTYSKMLDGPDLSDMVPAPYWWQGKRDLPRDDDIQANGGQITIDDGRKFYFLNPNDFARNMGSLHAIEMLTANPDGPSFNRGNAVMDDMGTIRGMDYGHAQTGIIVKGHQTLSSNAETRATYLAFRIKRTLADLDERVVALREAGRPEDATRLELFADSIIPPLERFVRADLPQLAGTLREKTGRKQFHYDLNDPLQEKVNDVLQRRI